QGAVDLHRPRPVAAAAGRHRRRLSPVGELDQPWEESRVKFSPDYVRIVLNENFEDAKAQFLEPLMAINYAHLVMLADQGIVGKQEATAIRRALDGIDVDHVRKVQYDGTYED